MAGMMLTLQTATHIRIFRPEPLTLEYLEQVSLWYMFEGNNQACLGII